MADEEDIEVCDFFPTDAQAALHGAPARPGKIGEAGTNTDELTHDCVAERCRSANTSRTVFPPYYSQIRVRAFVRNRYRGSYDAGAAVQGTAEDLLRRRGERFWR
jgi:hypothetical protein